MITTKLNIVHEARWVLPGAAPDTQDPSEYCEKRLSFGVDHPRYTFHGNLDVGDSHQVPVLAGLDRGYYRTRLAALQEVREDHILNRLPIWVARTAGYTALGVGIGLVSSGIHAPIGFPLIAKGVTLGVAFGAIGARAHAEASLLPYDVARSRLRVVAEMHDAYHDQTPAWWMSDRSAIFPREVLLGPAFHLAEKELREVGITLPGAERRSLPPATRAYGVNL